MKKHILHIAVLFFAVLFSCQQRDRNNIFDPNTVTDSLNISLRITRADTVIVLQWTKPVNIRFKAFRVYRKTAQESAFSLIRSLPPYAESCRDTVDPAGISYTYYITLLGADNESVPSKKISTLPGPGNYWILDLGAYNILAYTYDLQHTIYSKYAVFPPSSMALADDNQLGLITYTRSHYIEIFSRANSQTIAGFDLINYPFNSMYDSANKGFWITDSSGGLYLYSINTGELSLKSSAPLNPVQLLDDGDKMWIVDRKMKALLIFNKEGTFQSGVTHIQLTSFNDPYFMAIDRKNRNYFVLDHGAAEDKLYTFDASMNSITLLHSRKNLDKIRFDPLSNSLWLSVNDSLDAKLVQLSAAGLRLLELTGFRFITDLNVNPYDGSLTVADAGKRRVTRLRADGSIIAVLTNVYYPAKVYAQ